MIVSDILMNALLLIALILFLTVLYYKLGKKDAEQEINAILLRRNCLSRVFIMGRYISGLGKLSGLPALESKKILCAVTDHEYVFIGFPEDSWREVGEVPCDAVNTIVIENRKRLVQQLSETRKMESWRLLIDWNDNCGKKQSIVFEFTGPSALQSANTALMNLKRYREAYKETQPQRA